MPGMQSWNTRSTPATPKCFNGHDRQQPHSHTEQARNNHIQRPVRTHINATVRYENRGQKQQPPPPPKEYGANRSDRKVVRSVCRWKGTSSRRADPRHGVSSFRGMVKARNRGRAIARSSVRTPSSISCGRGRPMKSLRVRTTTASVIAIANPAVTSIIRMRKPPKIAATSPKAIRNGHQKSKLDITAITRSSPGCAHV